MEYRRQSTKLPQAVVQEQGPSVLAPDADSQKLFTVLCNYLSLAQFELARSVLDELFLLSPEKVVRVLRALVLADIPPQWLFSESVPTGAHMAWLALVEYRSLFQRVQNEGDGAPNPRQWQQLAAKVRKTPINPLGFMTHTRFQLEVLEAQQLKLAERKELVSGRAEGYKVQLSVEGQEFETPSVPSEEEHPVWDDDNAFNGRAAFANSVVQIKVLALRPIKGAQGETSWDAVGVCTLPLHQLRQKLEYHIWIPLESPLPPGQSAVNNPFKMVTTRGEGLAQVARQTYGRLRVRFAWTHGSSQMAGRFPPRTALSLEMDLLIFTAIYNARKAYYARLKGDADAMPSGSTALARRLAAEDPEQQDPNDPSLLAQGVLDDDAVDGFAVISNAPLLAFKEVANLREYAFWLLTEADPNNPLPKLAAKGELPEAFLSDAVFQQLRLVLRALPPAGHALCTRLHDMYRESSIQRQVNLDTLSQPTRFQSLYVGCVAEMLLKGEFNKAVLAAHHFTHSISPLPRRSDVADDLFSALIAHIHRAKSEPAAPRKTLVALLAKYSAAIGLAPGDMVDEASLNRSPLELQNFSNAHIVQQQQEALALQAEAYTALLGTEHEFALRRFCGLEDAFVHGSAEQRRALPLCFLTLHRALEALDKMKLDAETLARQQHQCLAAFFAEYYTFIRVTSQHVFEYAIRKALGYLKARNWKEAAVAIRPFSQLRPAVVLMAWDEFADDFAARDELITHLWRNRPAFPSDPCAEVRLTQWCNRLEFNVRLINAVLDHVDGPQSDPADRNDRAIRLLDTLRTHSILYALRDYLPTLEPHVLLKLLTESVAAAPEASRGVECEHDLHVLRAYYALRTVLSLMLGEVRDESFEQSADELKQLREKGEADKERKLRGKTKEDERREAEAKAAEEADPNKPVDIRTHDEIEEQKREQVQRSGPSLLDAVQDYVLAMTRTEFQVTTLEKLFCVLFMQQSDVQGAAAEDGAPASSGAAAAAAAAEEVSRGVEVSHLSLHSHLDRDPSENVVSVAKVEQSSPLVLDTAHCSVLLGFLKRTLEKVQAKIKSAHNANPDPQLLAHFQRLSALRVHVDEGVWRLHVLTQLGLQPSLDMLVAPLESLSAVFLKLDTLAESQRMFGAALNKAELARLGQVGNLVVAERWTQLCALVRERTKRKKSNVVEGVIEFIANFYKDPKAAYNSAAGSASATQALSNVMQGFFFAMDVAVTFSHVLTSKQYQEIVDYAIAFLQATKPSHDTREALELYNFYMAYAKHCRAHNMERFRLAEAFDAAKLDLKRHDAAERKRAEEAEDGGAESDALLQWVHAYRLSNRAKQAAKGETVVEAGWLTSGTGRPEDEVPARRYPHYIDRYADFCHALGIAAISDTLSEAELRELAAPAGDKKKKGGAAPAAADAKIADEALATARPSPWRSPRVLEYLTQNAADAAVEEKLMRTAPSTFAERLQRVSDRMQLLGRKLLPSLGAIRYALRVVPEQDVPATLRTALQVAQFLPAYARWLDARARVWETALGIMGPGLAGGTWSLPDAVRELLSKEDAFHDQEAMVRLIDALLKRSDVSMADKRRALDAADAVVAANPETQARAEAVVQALLLSIVDDPENSDERLRAQCIMRIKDVPWAAQMTNKYMERWDDAALAQGVLLKVLSDIKAAHPLRGKLAFRYNVVVLFQELVAAFPPAKSQEFIAMKDREAGGLSRAAMLSLMRVFQDWLGFESECRKALDKVLLLLLETRNIGVATKLFELYDKTKDAGDAYAFKLEESVRAKVTDLIEAAALSLYFLPNCNTHTRLQGIARLQRVAPMKVFFVCRALMEHLSDSRSRFMVAEFLARFLTAEPHVLEQLTASAARAGGDLYWAMTEEGEAWLGLVRVAARMLVALPEDVESALAQFHHDPKRIMRELLLGGRVTEAAKVLPDLRAYDGSELSRAKATSGQVVRYKRSAGPAVIDRAKLLAGGTSYDDIAVELLLDGDRFNAYSLVLGFAREVLTLEFDSMGKDVGFACFDMIFVDLERQLRGRTGGRRDSERPAIERAEDRIYEKQQYALVANACLDIVNGLSRKLGHHEHALFVVHLMKNVLTYYKAKLETRVVAEPLEDLEQWRASARSFERHRRIIESAEDLQFCVDRLARRYNAYRSLVFTEHELAQIDGRPAPPARKGAPRLPLLYSLRRVRFCLDDLIDAQRAAELRDRLVELDKMELARRVWEEAEGKAPEDFARDVQSKVANLKDVCEQFDQKAVKKSLA